jgi:hypothetical protein
MARNLFPLPRRVGQRDGLLAQVRFHFLALAELRFQTSIELFELESCNGVIDRVRQLSEVIVALDNVVIGTSFNAATAADSSPCPVITMNGTSISRARVALSRYSALRSGIRRSASTRSNVASWRRASASVAGPHDLGRQMRRGISKMPQRQVDVVRVTFHVQDAARAWAADRIAPGPVSVQSNRAPQHRRQAVEIVALLRHIIDSAKSKRVHHQLLITDTGHDDDRQELAASGQVPQDIDPVHVGQVVIQKQRIVNAGCEASEASLTC